MLPQPNSPVSPEQFIYRSTPIEAFRQCLRQGLLTGRTLSFAVLGDSGIGKSNLLLKFIATCHEFGYRMLPVFLSVSKDLGDCLRFAESLLNKLAETLATSSFLAARLRSEVRNWKLKRVSLVGFQPDREGSSFFLSSGSGLLRHTLAEAWERFLGPALINGAIFSLDDLHNLVSPSPEAVALALRGQFQSFAIEGLDYSVCFSAKRDYFADTKGLAEPAARFCTKRYLTPFTLQETSESVRAAFAVSAERSKSLSCGLYEKTLGQPYFLAFISQQLLALARGSPPESPARLWPETFQQLEREKFSSDLAQLSEKEIELLLAAGQSHEMEFTPAQFARHSHREYLIRLMERGLLIPTGRGRYKLYHPLFKLFLQGLKP